MRITKIVVTDEDGIEHEWEGPMGYVRIGSIHAKTKPYQRRVTASLLLEPQPEVKPTPAELAAQ